MNDGFRTHMLDPRLHPDTVRLARAVLDDPQIQALPGELRILDGMRDEREQAQYVADGRSDTLRSRHLTGHAFDFGVIINNDYQEDGEPYKPYGRRIKALAKGNGIPITWGGDWGWDFGHVELMRSVYPDVHSDVPKPIAKSTEVAAGGVSLSSVIAAVTALAADLPQEVLYVALAIILLATAYTIHRRKRRNDEEAT